MNGKLAILNLLHKRKRLLGTTSEKKKNDSLHNAYMDYYSLFQELDPMDQAEMADEDYVISALMLQELEYTKRFRLAAVVARFAKQNNISPEFEKYDTIIEWLWSRAAEEDNPPIALPDDRVIPYIPDVARCVLDVCRSDIREVGKYSVVKNAYQFIKNDSRFQTTDEWTEYGRNYVSFANGLLCLNDGQMLTHSPDIFTTYHGSVSISCPA